MKPGDRRIYIDRLNRVFMLLCLFDFIGEVVKRWRGLGLKGTERLPLSRPPHQFSASLFLKISISHLKWERDNIYFTVLLYEERKIIMIKVIFFNLTWIKQMFGLALYLLILTKHKKKNKCAKGIFFIIKNFTHSYNAFAQNHPFSLPSNQSAFLPLFFYHYYFKFMCF